MLFLPSKGGIGTNKATQSYGKANSEQETYESFKTFNTEEDAALQQLYEMQIYLAAANTRSALGQHCPLLFRIKSPTLKFTTFHSKH